MAVLPLLADRVLIVPPSGDTVSVARTSGRPSPIGVVEGPYYQRTFKDVKVKNTARPLPLPSIPDTRQEFEEKSKAVRTLRANQRKLEEKKAQEAAAEENRPVPNTSDEATDEPPPELSVDPQRFPSVSKLERLMAQMERVSGDVAKLVEEYDSDSAFFAAEKNRLIVNAAKDSVEDSLEEVTSRASTRDAELDSLRLWFQMRAVLDWLPSDDAKEAPQEEIADLASQLETVRKNASQLHDRFADTVQFCEKQLRKAAETYKPNSFTDEDYRQLRYALEMSTRAVQSLTTSGKETAIKLLVAERAMVDLRDRLELETKRSQRAENETKDIQAAAAKSLAQERVDQEATVARFEKEAEDLRNKLEVARKQAAGQEGNRGQVVQLIAKVQENEILAKRLHKALREEKVAGVADRERHQSALKELGERATADLSLQASSLQRIMDNAARVAQEEKAFLLEQIEEVEHELDKYKLFEEMDREGVSGSKLGTPMAEKRERRVVARKKAAAKAQGQREALERERESVVGTAATSAEAVAQELAATEAEQQAAADKSKQDADDEATAASPETPAASATPTAGDSSRARTADTAVTAGAMTNRTSPPSRPRSVAFAEEDSVHVLEDTDADGVATDELEAPGADTVGEGEAEVQDSSTPQTAAAAYESLASKSSAELGKYVADLEAILASGDTTRMADDAVLALLHAAEAGDLTPRAERSMRNDLADAVERLASERNQLRKQLRKLLAAARVASADHEAALRAVVASAFSRASTAAKGTRNRRPMTAAPAKINVGAPDAEGITRTAGTRAKTTTPAARVGRPRTSLAMSAAQLGDGAASPTKGAAAGRATPANKKDSPEAAGPTATALLPTTHASAEASDDTDAAARSQVAQEVARATARDFQEDVARLHAAVVAFLRASMEGLDAVKDPRSVALLARLTGYQLPDEPFGNLVTGYVGALSATTRSIATSIQTWQGRAAAAAKASQPELAQLVQRMQRQAAILADCQVKLLRQAGERAEDASMAKSLAAGKDRETAIRRLTQLVKDKDDSLVRQAQTHGQALWDAEDKVTVVRKQLDAANVRIATLQAQLNSQRHDRVARTVDTEREKAATEAAWQAAAREMLSGSPSRAKSKSRPGTSGEGLRFRDVVNASRDLARVNSSSGGGGGGGGSPGSEAGETNPAVTSFGNASVGAIPERRVVFADDVLPRAASAPPNAAEQALPASASLNTSLERSKSATARRSRTEGVSITAASSSVVSYKRS